jgi:hypothetical protein
MNASRDDRPAIGPRPWREPYEVIKMFASVQTEEEAILSSTGIAMACRELKRRGFYFKQRAARQPTLRDDSFATALRSLTTAFGANEVLSSSRDPRVIEALRRCRKVVNALSVYRNRE